MAKWIQENISEEYELIDIGCGCGLMSFAISLNEHKPNLVHLIDPLPEKHWKNSQSIPLHYKQLSEEHQLKPVFNWTSNIWESKLTEHLQKVFILDSYNNSQYYDYLISNFKGSYIIADNVNNDKLYLNSKISSHELDLILEVPQKPDRKKHIF